MYFFLCYCISRIFKKEKREGFVIHLNLNIFLFNIEICLKLCIMTHSSFSIYSLNVKHLGVTFVFRTIS